jgi:dipeptidase E
MPKIRLLAFSSSRVGNSSYLETAAPVIKKFLGDAPMNIAFVPFASVSPDYEVYSNMVRNGLSAFSYNIQTVQGDTAKKTIENADAIMVGGGNTFKLLHDLYDLQLMELIKDKVNNGTPFIGWSAGSNIAGATICTSNDMPIINPGSFIALGFLPFQINPHYYNQPVAGFNGETRNQRLAEFLQLNTTVPIVALPEGTALLLEEGKLKLIGSTNAFLFRWQHEAPAQTELTPGDDLSYLLY